MANWKLDDLEWHEVYDDVVDDVGEVKVAYQYIEPYDEEDTPGDLDVFVFDATGEKDLTYEIPQTEFRRILKEARKRFFEHYNHTQYLKNRARRFSSGY